jgi:hypothetical protein
MLLRLRTPGRRLTAISAIGGLLCAAIWALNRRTFTGLRNPLAQDEGSQLSAQMCRFRTGQ